MKNFFGLVAVLLVLSGCSIVTKNEILQKEYYTKKDINLSFYPKSFQIIDKREKTDNREITIPSFSFSEFKDEISPNLSISNRKIIESEFNKYITDKTNGMNVEVLILEGKKELSSGFLTKREYVKVSIKVNVYDKIHNPFYVSSGGQAFYDVKSISASADYIEQLYQKALRDCIYKAVENISDFEKSTSVQK